MKKIFIGFLISMFGLSFLHGIESVIGSIFILLGINELNEDEHCFTNAALFAKIMIFYYAAVCICGFAGINFFSTAVGTLVSFASILCCFTVFYKIIKGYNAIEINRNIDLNSSGIKNNFIIYVIITLFVLLFGNITLFMSCILSGVNINSILMFDEVSTEVILSTFGDGFGWSFSIIILIMSFISLIFYIKIIIKLYKAYKIYYEAKKE